MILFYLGLIQVPEQVQQLRWHLLLLLLLPHHPLPFLQLTSNSEPSNHLSRQ